VPGLILLIVRISHRRSGLCRRRSQRGRILQQTGESLAEKSQFLSF
jgi:hypothetical protein